MFSFPMNYINSICEGFGITFLLWIFPTTPVDSRIMRIFHFYIVYVSCIIHKECISKFAFNEFAHLEISWNQDWKKNLSLSKKTPNNKTVLNLNFRGFRARWELFTHLQQLQFLSIYSSLYKSNLISQESSHLSLQLF